MSVRIELDTSRYDPYIARLISKIPELPKRFVEEGSQIIFDRFVANMPEKSGKMKATATREVYDTHAVMKTNTGYGKAVDKGYGPHKISARVGRSLRFEINGKLIFRKSVMHPGFAGHHFSDRTVQETDTEIKAMLARIFREAVS